MAPFARTSYAAVMESSWSESRAAFEAAAEWFISTASQVGDRWEQPGLGEWDVRALVGHASRSFITIETYLAQPPDSIDIESAALYYSAIRPILAGPGVADRGRAAGEALGDDPVTAVREIADRVTALVERSTGVTEADIRLFTTLVRFDAVYHGHFKCNRQKLTEMPVLWAYARDLFQTPGFGDTIDFEQIKRHYYVTHDDINPTRIVPIGPQLDLESPHGRDALS